ncbi:MAG: hypothetical protein JSV38_11460 [Desulfobacterales bacterium]|nr:MAG: hypothetical protein JSV38_11460 [Desulfobacterales bacterium]
MVFATCGKKSNKYDEYKADTESEGFTFLNLGENTEFSDEVRDNLRKQLGSDAIEKRTPLDLSINYKGFLKKHLPSLNALNQKLNSPVGERIEHNTIKLTYRYARKKKVPFEYVELVFSNYTKKPLLFYIKSKQEGAGIVDVITKKYGKANTIKWEMEKGTSLYWTKNRSKMLISIKNDRFGNPEYHTTIYYVPSIENLIQRERLEDKKREDEIKKSGNTAF